MLRWWDTAVSKSCPKSISRCTPSIPGTILQENSNVRRFLETPLFHIVEKQCGGGGGSQRWLDSCGAKFNQSAKKVDTNENKGVKLFASLVRRLFRVAGSVCRSRVKSLSDSGSWELEPWWIQGGATIVALL